MDQTQALFTAIQKKNPTNHLSVVHRKQQYIITNTAMSMKWKSKKFGGSLKIIATIKDPIIIKKILDHISKIEEPILPAFQLPEAHAPPIRLNT